MWRCVSSRCRSRAVASAPGDTLCIAELPTAPLAPLYLTCGACSTRMVACECCHVLLAVDREVDGVLLCTRCGFLTVLDATLRVLVQIPPFSRVILTCVTPSVSELERLRTEWVDWETRARLAQQRTSSEGNAAAPTGGASTPQSHKRRRRPGDDAYAVSSPQSEPMLSSTPPGRPSMSAELKAEGKHLQAEIQRVKRHWHRLLGEAAPDTTTRNLPSLQQPMFSSTHLHILEIMYEKTMDKLELAELVGQVNHFLLQQSTTVKTKYDLLASIRSYQQIQQLSSITPTASSQQAVQLMIHCAEEQVRYLQSHFDASARQYLRLVAVANRHLFTLYNAAQGLSKLQSQQPHDAVVRVLPALSAVSPSPAFALHENSRKRRLFGTSCGSHESVTSTPDSVSRVQQDLEMHHRISELAKKIEVWRGLSFTIASCCVLTAVELAQTQQIDS